MKTIMLTQGYFAIVDDADFPEVSQFKWYADVDRDEFGGVRNVYAGRKVGINGKQKNLRLHRFILGTKDSKVRVDHVDGNGLNCTRGNLRAATESQNRHNSKRAAHNTAGRKGVRWLPNAKRYQARIMIDGKRVALGCSVDLDETARLYDAAALAHFGEFARLNFPPPGR